MKHFDIETYARTTLEGFVMSPKNDMWQGISDTLDQLSFRKRKKMIRIKKAAVFIALFAYVPSATLNSDTVRNAASMAIQHETPSAQGGSRAMDKMENEDKTTRIHPPATAYGKENQQGKKGVEPKKRTIRLVDTATKDTTKRPREIVRRNLNDLERATVDRHIEVADAEIDSLMERAAQNLQRERALQKSRDAFTHEMLAEVEREIETKNGGFYQDLKRSYTTLKTVISN